MFLLYLDMRIYFLKEEDIIISESYVVALRLYYRTTT